MEPVAPAPYWFTYARHVVGGWVGRTLGDVCRDEAAGFQCPDVGAAIAAGHLFVAPRFVAGGADGEPQLADIDPLTFTAELAVAAWAEAPASCFGPRQRTVRATTVQSESRLPGGTADPSVPTLDLVLALRQVVCHRVLRVEAPTAAPEPIEVLGAAEVADGWVIGVAKPASLPVHPCGQYFKGSLLWRLQHGEFAVPSSSADLHSIVRRGGAPLHACHRLDRCTSGVTLLATTPAAARAVTTAIAAKSAGGPAVQKRYLARVAGRLPAAHMTIDAPLRPLSGGVQARWDVCPDVADGKRGRDGAPSVTAITIADEVAFDPQRQESIVACVPVTGRTHQLRAHLALVGCPILLDFPYAAALPSPPLWAVDPVAFRDHCRRLVGSSWGPPAEESLAQYGDAMCICLHAAHYEATDVAAVGANATNFRFAFTAPAPPWAKLPE